VRRPRVWIVDGNNVFGSRPDGWWRDRSAAAARLTGQVADWCRNHADRVILVFDGRAAEPVESAASPAGDRLSIDFAGHGVRGAADDRIAALVEAHRDAAADLVVVSADRGLIARLPRQVGVEGPVRFLERLAAAGSGLRASSRTGPGSRASS
jgi:predicted RNA-binding protein with PIN domain